ncbi:MAG: LL-diaminopimelate aminotransferase [Firmicutes bacterium]|nr:LL-diaminopimelate aminotransferase [Bacillota bacterium]
MRTAQRIAGLASDIFTEMSRLRKQVEARGVKVINLGIGSPDQPPPAHVQEALSRALANPRVYGYPTSEGTPEFRAAVAAWYKRRFNVDLDPATEVLTLMGSQDGLAHLAQAFVDPGDIALVPDPGYPIYSASIILAGGVLHPLPLLEKNGFLPDFSQVKPEVSRKARMLILNYPNNPVSAVADRDFFARAVAFAREYDLLLSNDLAYSELTFDGYRPPSLLEIPGAKEVAVEFNSLSKTFNLAGCRIGYVVGNPMAIEALARVKSNIDYGVFVAVQQAGVAALTGPQEFTRENAAVYEHRRDVLLDGLAAAGWTIPKPKATMFVWASVPPGFDSRSFAIALLEKAGVAVIPGTGFGARGEGYVRIALVRDEETLREVVRRVEKSGLF